MEIFKRIENMVASILFILGVVVSLYAVLMRYIFSSAQSWTTETYTTLLLQAIFIGVGTALRDNTHIGIDYIYDKVNGTWKKMFDVVFIIVGVGFSVFFLVSGLQIVITTFNQGLITQDLGIPVWITYLIMPLGGMLLLIHFIEKAFLWFGNASR